MGPAVIVVAGGGERSHDGGMEPEPTYVDPDGSRVYLAPMEDAAHRVSSHQAFVALDGTLEMHSGPADGYTLVMRAPVSAWATSVQETVSVDGSRMDAVAVTDAVERFRAHTMALRAMPLDEPR